MIWGADDRRGTAPKPILAPQLAPPHLSAPTSFYVPFKTIEDRYLLLDILLMEH